MNQTAHPLSGPAAAPQKARTSFRILGAISLSHLLNDMIQSLILAIYPLLQAEFSLTFVQIGMITLTFQLASSLLQPVVGYMTDKHPMPWSLPIGMCFTLSGLVLLAMAGSFHMSCSPQRWLVPALRYFTRNHPAWREWPPAVVTVLPSQFSRLAATSVALWDRYWRLSSSRHMVRVMWPGLFWLRY